MNHVYKRLTTFDFCEEVFHPSKLPQFEIKLHFFFKSQNKHFILHQNQPQYLLQTLPSSNGMTSAAVAAPPLDPKHVAEAVTKAIGSRLLARELGTLIELVHEHVRRSFLTAETPARRGVLNLCFQVRIEHHHVYNFVGGGPRMVPASDHSFALLEECGRADVAEEERCCCICLEELGDGGGGGAVRMPCKHVFHGGCIKKWLRKSHYCPLCRYEMPTE